VANKANSTGICSSTENTQLGVAKFFVNAAHFFLQLCGIVFVTLLKFFDRFASTVE